MIYKFLKDNEIIDEKHWVHAIYGLAPDIIWAAIGMISLGWWLMLFVASAIDHYRKEFKT